ncbi:MAG: thioredoxin family protein [Actinomycetota bacterium]|nr:thioredoxin family protein [Actinomycetota bacterium]
MEQVVIGLVLVAVVAAVAFVVSRRSTPDAPTRGVARVPAQLDRNDFEATDAEWLLVLFSSATCGTCASARSRLESLDEGVVAGRVARAEVTWEQHGPIHERYGVDGVPLIVVVDERGVVRASVVGVPKAGEIEEALAALEPSDGTGS